MQYELLAITEEGFQRRHIGPNEDDVSAMLSVVNASSLNQLIDQVLPANIRLNRELMTDGPFSERDAISTLSRLASSNEIYTSLIGLGYSASITPPVIQRNVLENPAWYTAYTPYQPEISQGRLEALLNFQTMVAELTGLDIANASLLDEATAAAEAMSMAERLSPSKEKSFFVDEDVHPQTIAVLRTRAEPLGWRIVVGDPDRDLVPGKVFGALFQYPGSTGEIRDLRTAISSLKSTGGTAIVAADILALTLLVPPGEFGADIAVGSTQRFGVPLGYGGPHAAYISCRDELKRILPGRLVGVTIDSRGNPAYRLALQTREQHIRRDKATSNICTAQVLLAVIAAFYVIYHGRHGLQEIATMIAQRTAVLAAGLRKMKFEIRNRHFFDTVVVNVGSKQADIMNAARAARINFRVIGEGHIGISLDETSDRATVERVWEVFGEKQDYSRTAQGVAPSLNPRLARTSSFLTHPVFSLYRSETELLRYIRRLSGRDLALDRTMIPLGSCTMKLNATAEMIPITLPGFADIHPFVPPEQALGYHAMFEKLQAILCEITGYDAVSLQPNSGAQGEYAGLLAIRAFHRSRGEAQRNICLIPSSAHGTNPASANMAGMKVVVVRCDASGNIDVEDMEQKASLHKDDLAAVMITYPSTHGVFEEEIKRICEIVHGNGGQVYLDGANMNAQVGLARPGDYGADVSHLNLHKTFCIPHGGGGPGMGPIGVKNHLKQFLPGHPFIDHGEAVSGPVAATPYGSASILAISYSYILMMGGAGLRRASEIAILNANYVASRLDEHFPVLYTNRRGRVAHECIVDTRKVKESCGVTVEDIAKRLIDYGFHAPTMSFPVPGTLMIEPTESESKAEIDRLIEAMISIREEIHDIESGTVALADSPLRLAPHTALDVTADDWTRKYSRTKGCFPGNVGPQDKYWSPVNRVDNVFGDRNIICSCPPLSSYQDGSGTEQKHRQPATMEA